MGFFKRKAVGSQPSPTKAENVEKETRRRHRLSKPQTNNSATNQPFTVQQSASRSRVDGLGLSPISPTFSQTAPEEPRTFVKSPVLDAEPAFTSSSGTERQTWPGPAVVAQVTEGTHNDPETPSPASIHVQKSRRRPFSNMFVSRRSSNSQLKSLQNSELGTSPDSRVASVASSSSPVPGEDTVEGSPRLERRASFTPGVATRMNKDIVRKPLPSQIEPVPRLYREKSNENHGVDQIGGSDQENYYDTTSELPTSSSLQILDYERDWAPPPHIVRTATPSDLDYTHLGGLRLGSLHVVNGRASPPPSDFAKQLMRRSSGLRRDASSEYDGSEVGSISTDLGDQIPRLRTPPPSAWKGVQVRERSQLQNVYSSSSLQPGDGNLVANMKTHSLAMQNAPSLNNTPQISPDKASAMAEMYMAELPDSPYSPRRSQSPVGSVLRTTTKKTEYDDDLFEDETVDESVYESADPEADRSNTSTSRTPTPSDTASQHEDASGTYVDRNNSLPSMHLQLPSTNHVETSDSGYSSNASLPSLLESKSLVAQRIKAFEKPLEVAKTHNTAANRAQVEERKPGQRSFRPILKQNRATAPELPLFKNLHPSTTSVATSQTTETSQTTATSTGSVPKSPRKLQKRRRSSQPVPVQEIAVQGSHNVDENCVPPIPDQQRANLNTRVSAVPELQRTFKTMHHTKDSASSVGVPFSPVEIRFPSPSPNDGLEGDPPFLSSSSPFHVAKPRNSFMAKVRGARRMSQQGRTSGVSEKDARAIVNQFDSTTSALGGPSPYEIARNTASRPSSRNDSPNGRMPHDVLVKPNRPKSMMDDRTASEWARSRSKNIFERDRKVSAERQSSFNSAATPGKAPRPQSFIPPRAQTFTQANGALLRQQFAAPKTLPLTFNQDFSDTEHWEGQNQLPRSDEMYWEDHASFDQDDSPAPLPPRHSPRPSFIEPEEEVEEMTLAPPPPSHSPRPVILDNEEVQDIWAAQAQAWKNRRKSLGEFLGHNQTNDFSCDDHSTTKAHRTQWDELYPTIPPRQSQSSFVQRAPAWQPDTEHHGYPVEPSRYHSNSRTFPAPSGESYVEDMVRKPRSRRVSQSNSYAGSYAGSLAEELHPPDLERPHPPPQFGRYSGGLNYEYDRGAGFGGSAGTRSFSGVAKGLRKGLPLSTGFGVDLSDVPIIAGLQRM